MVRKLLLAWMQMNEKFTHEDRSSRTDAKAFFFLKLIRGLIYLTHVGSLVSRSMHTTSKLYLVAAKRILGFAWEKSHNGIWYVQSYY